MGGKELDMTEHSHTHTPQHIVYLEGVLEDWNLEAKLAFMGSEMGRWAICRGQFMKDV